MKRLFAIVILGAALGCSLNTRPIGTHDPAVEIARANAEAEKARAQASVSMMEALVAALGRLVAVPAPTPVPTPGEAVCIGPDGVTVIRCEDLR